ncbi:hypothetical protein DPMN_149168 [Dreissena polymorpha]|uniref:Uncharacterized protein n=1 Tax=Dreissena polymorpha TaxID=45954 RepID=A0A9D4FDW3_DREPO|nr:hypothetical protein DPMN_149168 [Dreissena polymorpha]
MVAPKEITLVFPVDSHEEMATLTVEPVVGVEVNLIEVVEVNDRTVDILGEEAAIEDRRTSVFGTLMFGVPLRAVIIFMFENIL